MPGKQFMVEQRPGKGVMAVRTAGAASARVARPNRKKTIALPDSFLGGLADIDAGRVMSLDEAIRRKPSAA